jgi:ketosteroid isomerase-like protein
VFKRIVWMGAIVLVAACQTTPHPPAARAPQGADPAAAQRLLETDRAFASLSQRAGTAEAFARYMAADGVQLPPDGEPVVGRDAVFQSLAAQPHTRLLWTPRQAGVAASGELGWTWGEWTARDAQGRVLGRGRYVNVWVTDEQGNWRVRIDMANAQP